MTFKLYYHFQQCIGAKPCAAGSFSCFSWHDNSPSHRSWVVVGLGLAASTASTSFCSSGSILFGSVWLGMQPNSHGIRHPASARPLERPEWPEPKPPPQLLILLLLLPSPFRHCTTNWHPSPRKLWVPQKLGSLSSWELNEYVCPGGN